MTSFSIADPPPACSVSDLVMQRLSDSDGWNLALVQRDEVWDELRMRHLLDSLLAGYPIGAILLASVRGSASRELRTEQDGSRTEVEAQDGSWQVLDGQQRINALYSIFTDQGRYGRFLLDVLRDRPSPSPAQRRSARQRALPHIAHLNAADDDLDGRERYIDLSAWAAWFPADGLTGDQITASNIGALLHELDRSFKGDLTSHDAETAATNLRRLVRAWTQQSIPILRAELDSPVDVLEVFARINLGGVNVSGPDVYFAGIKTFWRDAESRLEAVTSETPMLRSRIGALRFLSRLVSRGLGFGDVIPLSVDQLSGIRGELLQQGLDEATASNSVIRRRIKSFADWYPKNSELGYALKQCTAELWDDVLAWVAASPTLDEAWLDKNKSLIDTYLLGATLFRYRTALGDAFHRLAFLEALVAGSQGEPFPLSRILSVTRAKTELRGAREQAVLSLGEEAHRQILAERNGRMLSALAQRIPYEMEAEQSFDWDHIFPKAKAARMWQPGQGTRRRHHPDRHLINSAGNFWALSPKANRTLQDECGRKKFDQLDAWLSNHEKGVWCKEHWSITDDEIAKFTEVDDKLTDDPVSINEAMHIFKETVQARARRLLSSTLDRFPDLRLFAADTHLEKHDPTIAPTDLRDALALEVYDRSLRTASTKKAAAAIKARREALSDQLRHILSEKKMLAADWHWTRGSGSRERRTHAGYQLVDGNCIELMLTWSSSIGAKVEVKAYPQRGHAGGNKLYPEFDHVGFGAQWSDTDAAICEGFLREVDRLTKLHPR